jgi:hypothetical protein
LEDGLKPSFAITLLVVGIFYRLPDTAKVFDMAQMSSTGRTQSPVS